MLRADADRLDETPVIVVTAYGGGAAAIEAMKLGAYDYITKPFDLDDVLFAVRRALTQRTLAAQVEALSGERFADADDEELAGRGPAMMHVFKTIGRVAATREPVLILGESGTGKELAANAVHRNSTGGPAVHQSESVRPESDAAGSKLRPRGGAFTGAVARRAGRFEQAAGGTLFLDEIGELDVDLQAKLLRVLQTGRFERVGGEEALEADVRLIAATNRDLPARIAEGRFREDLYYRLNVVTLEMPPLRQRREDIPLLADQLVKRLARQVRLAPPGTGAGSVRPCWRRGRGRATCANCRMFWRGRRSWCAAGPSGRKTCNRPGRKPRPRRNPSRRGRCCCATSWRRRSGA